MLLTPIGRARSANFALIAFGLGASVVASPKSIFAVIAGFFQRSKGRNDQGISQGRVIKLTPIANQILDELTSRLNLSHPIIIAELNTHQMHSLETQIYAFPRSSNDPAIISMSEGALAKTFDRGDPDHLTYRLRLLLQLAQIKVKGNEKRANLLFCAIVTGSVAAASLKRLSPLMIVTGLTLGQWVGNFCVSTLMRKAHRNAQIAAVKALTEHELHRKLEEHFTAFTDLQNPLSWWDAGTIPYDLQDPEIPQSKALKTPELEEWNLVEFT